MDSLYIMDNLSNKSEQFKGNKLEAYNAYGKNLNQSFKPKGIKGLSASMSEKILQAAVDNNLPIHEDSDLIKMLAKLDFLKSIPSEYYKVVADIMCYIYKMDDLKKSNLAERIQ
ncbi:MAG: hypothetical protein NTW25_05440 [Candidatus Kapabacteria bacterium]|nr:hypothetical protein [Candidatus Kapabacteria bacterium]